jgi:hypothetical protein
MALVDADKQYPDQWRRLTVAKERDSDVLWGDPILPNSALAGKTAEDLASWAANCKAKIAFYLGRIPEDPAKNDGFWEVRCSWHAKRADFLLEKRKLLMEMNSVSPSKPPAIRPMIPTPGGWPGARNVSYTKMSDWSMETTNGCGQDGSNEEIVKEPFPSALLEDALRVQPWPNLDPAIMRKPFKRPRTMTEKETIPKLRRSSRLKKKNTMYCDEVLSESDTSEE